MATSLTSADCPSLDHAHEYFGAIPGCLVLRPSNNHCVPWLPVPEGCYALVTRTGKLIYHPETGIVWGPGRHNLSLLDTFLVDVAYLVTKQHIVFDSPVKGCKTLDNVSVEIDNSIVFRIMGDEELAEDPDLVRKFVFEVTPAGLQNQLENAVDEAMRTLARSMRHTEVYGLRSVTVASDADMGGGLKVMEGDSMLDKLQTEAEELGKEAEDDDGGEGGEESGQGIEMKEQELDDDDDDDLVGDHEEASTVKAQKANFKGQSATERMKRSLNRQFNSQGIQIVDVMIKDVKLPREQVQAMSNRTMQVSIKTEQKMSHRNEMQQERYDQETQTIIQSFDEERGKARVEGEQRANEARVRLNNERADAEKSLNVIRNEMEVNINSINAQTDREVAQLREESNEILVNMRTENEAEAARLRAENDLEIEELLSAARLEVARNEADASMILSEAEGRMAPMLHTKKDFETDLKKLEVYKAFGLNPDVVISPSQDHTVNTLLLCDKILEGEDALHGTDRNDRCRILAEMMVMNTGSHTVAAK